MSSEWLKFDNLKWLLQTAAIPLYTRRDFPAVSKGANGYCATVSGRSNGEASE